MQTRIVESIHAVDASAWNALLTTDQPFVQHDFIAALEASDSVSVERGWRPAHVLVEDDNGALVAAAPVYEKNHSFGEFVFDFAWANAYRQCGLAYYPKLVNAIPFTPVAGPRLFARDEPAHAHLVRRLGELAGENACSSMHTLFAHDRDIRALEAAGASIRRGCQYRWFNRDYVDFDDFLSRMSSKRRKQIRRERRHLAEAGVTVEVLTAADITPALWQTLYAFYDRTYAVRGQEAYLTPAFFDELSRRMPDRTLFFVARHSGRPVGMAFMLRDADTLYGRHWGCETDYQDLHFETCYYAAIDYCIAHGFARFDAGVQGEHKIRRGFEPVATWSAHWIDQPQLRAAIDNFTHREADMVADLEAEQRERASFTETPAP